MYSKVLVDSYLYIPKDELKSLERARERLTLFSRYSDNTSFTCYHELPHYFGVPRYFYPNWDKIAREVNDCRLRANKVNWKFTSKLRPGQEPVIERFSQYYHAGKTGFTLQAPPGFGKTVAMLKMMHIIGLSALVVVPRSNLVDQWVERITEHTSLKRSEIGVVNGKNVRWRGCPITVALVHSVAAQLDDNKAFHRNFGNAVFDEVDRSVPPATFSPVLGMFPSYYRIGASATVTRADGLHKIFDWHISQVKLKGKDVGRMKPKVMMVQYSKSSGYVHAGSKRLNRRGMLISRLGVNTRRNALLSHYINLIYKSGRRVIVLSDRTEQLVLLRDLMHKRHGVPYAQMGYYCDQVPHQGKKRKITKRELEHSASDCTIIFGTYGKVAIGTDIPDLAGLVYGTPQSDVTQTQGRIERMLEGKQQPVVVDFIDTYYKDAVAWANRREKYYRRMGLKLKLAA